MTRTHAIPACLALLLALAPALTGCERMRERRKARAQSAPTEPARIIAPDRADVTPAEAGLEVVVWTADDTYFRVGRALADLGVPEPSMPDDERRAWERAGLRVVAVPTERLDELLAKAPPLTAVQRQRYAQLPAWTPIVRGPALPPGVPSPDAGTIPPGHPRLIARSWIEPGVADNARTERLRTELAIQMERARRPALTPDPGSRSAADAGEVFRALITAIHADASTAAVIVAEHPAVDWSDLPEPPPPPANQAAPTRPAVAGPRPDEPGRPDADTDRPPPAAQPPATAPAPHPGPPGGPAPPGDRTLGEWMLAAPGVPARDGRRPVGPRKVVLVLIPRLQPDHAPGPARDGEP